MSCCTLWHVFSLRIWKLSLSFSIWLKIIRDEISLYVQRIVAEIEYHMPYVQHLSFYLTSKLEIRSEENQAETDKSALMLRKCPVRPLFTVYDLIKKCWMLKIYIFTKFLVPFIVCRIGGSWRFWMTSSLTTDFDQKPYK